MLSSPRRPSSTMRIFSSAERCRRVALRISRTVFSALSGMRLLACLIVAPQRGYDEPAILSYAISSFCPTSADGLQRWKSHSLGGRPQIDADVRALIRRMSVDNPLWGAPRIHGELLKLGFEVAQSSVAKYMVKRSWPPSQG